MESLYPKPYPKSSRVDTFQMRLSGGGDEGDCAGLPRPEAGTGRTVEPEYIRTLGFWLNY